MRVNRCTLECRDHKPQVPFVGLLSPDGGQPDPTGLHEWSELIEVPASKVIKHSFVLVKVGFGEDRIAVTTDLRDCLPHTCSICWCFSAGQPGLFALIEPGIGIFLTRVLA